MLKKNGSKKTEIPEEPVLAEESNIEDEALLEDEFDGPINALELENDDFDDWSPELENMQNISKTPTASKPTASLIKSLNKKNIEALTIPTKFICPLSKQVMTEPVRIAGSKVPVAYEKSAIEAYYDENGTDPMTHEDLNDDVHFMPDLALTREITDFCLKHMVSTEKNVTNHLSPNKKTQH